MNYGLSRQEALQLCMDALTEPLGLLVWTNDPETFRQHLYRAKASDVAFLSIEIRLPLPEHVAICHEPLREVPLNSGTSNSLSDESTND